MRAALWPDADPAALAGEAGSLLAREDFAVFGARHGSRWVGFVEVGTRDVAEGCATSPVGYVEGIWVDPACRRQGIARRLVAAAAGWAARRGYRELASDTELANVGSQAFHARLGFAETERLVTYRLALTGRSRPGLP